MNLKALNSPKIKKIKSSNLKFWKLLKISKLINNKNFIVNSVPAHTHFYKRIDEVMWPPINNPYYPTPSNILHLLNSLVMSSHQMSPFESKSRYQSCKVEFNQPSCWLYSVSNLLVFQQLVSLYLGEILVRVVSEIVWRNAKECARKTGTHDWISRVTRGCKPPETAHVPGMSEVEASRQLEHYKTK